MILLTANEAKFRVTNSKIDNEMLTQILYVCVCMCVWCVCCVCVCVCVVCVFISVWSRNLNNEAA